MQIIDAQTKRLEHLLANWVDYYSRGGDSGIGYPTMSIEGRMRANGGVVGHSAGAAKMDVNEDAEMIEDLVKEMSIGNSDWADALRARYFARDTDFPLSKTGKRRDIVSKLAYKRHISNRMFQVRVKCAKIWLLENLKKFNGHIKKKHENYFLKLAA